VLIFPAHYSVFTIGFTQYSVLVLPAHYIAFTVFVVFYALYWHSLPDTCKIFWACIPCPLLNYLHNILGWYSLPVIELLTQYSGLVFPARYWTTYTTFWVFPAIYLHDILGWYPLPVTELLTLYSGLVFPARYWTTYTIFWAGIPCPLLNYLHNILGWYSLPFTYTIFWAGIPCP
jgi:hypothetical protein